MLFLRGRKKRVCVVGLDGVPVGLLRRLAERSVMPRVAQMLEAGGLTQMRAAIPPVSSVSWSSFMTGAGPGEHGIFGFTDVAPNSYRLRFPGFPHLAVPTFWDSLGEARKRCAIINQPSTYPARAVPGALVSGFVALDLDRSVWPAEHLAPLQRIGYLIDVDTKQAPEEPDRLLDDLEATLATRRQAAQYFWQREAWDYFQLVVTGTDRLHHFLWNAVEHDDDPRHERAMRYYRAVDDLIADLWDRFHQRRPQGREGEGFFLLSDHGFTAARREVRVNAWLQENGYLAYTSEDPQSVADIAPGSRAFALDPGRIYINVHGRFADGCVARDEVEYLREDIRRGLLGLSFEDEPVMSRVVSREEVYRGPRAAFGPDLVAMGRNGFDLKGTTRGDGIFADARLQGMHTWDDALVWSMLPVPDDPEIADLAGVITGWLLA